VTITTIRTTNHMPSPYGPTTPATIGRITHVAVGSPRQGWGIRPMA
jgi:hypothetical protein